tara:strand:- start:143 stop:862 length:720 start_codon:yes stop_codon:yes gene_type:complete
MKNSGLKYFLLALIFGLLAALGSFIYLNEQKATPSQNVNISVPVVAETIQAFQVIEGKHIRLTKLPEDAVHTKAVLDTQTIVGKYASTEMIPGEQVLESRLLETIDDVLPSVIKKGHRAISIMSSEFQGVGDMIVPGDQVDLVVYLPEKTRKEVVIREDQAQIFVENVKVLAISRVTLQGSTAHVEEVPDRYSVTLEVPVNLTKEIVLAENIGVIEILLRGQDDTGKSQEPPVFWEDLR